MRPWLHTNTCTHTHLKDLKDENQIHYQECMQMGKKEARRGDWTDM